MPTLLQQMEYLLRYWDTLSVPERDEKDAVHMHAGHRQRDRSPPAAITERGHSISPLGTPVAIAPVSGRKRNHENENDSRQPQLFSPDATLTGADNTIGTSGLLPGDPNNLTWQLQSVLGLTAPSLRSPVQGSDADENEDGSHHKHSTPGRREGEHRGKNTASLLQQAARNAVADVERDEARHSQGTRVGDKVIGAPEDIDTSSAFNGRLTVSFKGEDTNGGGDTNGGRSEQEDGAGSSSKRRSRRERSHGRCWYCRHSQRYDRLMFASDEEFEVQLRSDVARIEMSRAMLRLYVSSAGAFQTPLERVFSFLFNYIDHHIDWCVDYARNRSVLNTGGTRGGGSEGRRMQTGGFYPDGPEVANDDDGDNDDGAEAAPEGGGPSVDRTAAFESVRRAEKRANEVMAAAADQKKRHTQDIVAARKRIDQLEKLLAHQMALTHRISDGDSTSIKQLVARAEKEKLIDEIEKQLADAMTSNDTLSEQVQSLRELNAAYARQSVELVARLHAVQEHNVRFASHGHVAIHEMIRLQKEIETLRTRLATVQNEYYVYVQHSAHGHRNERVNSVEREGSTSDSWHGFETEATGAKDRLSLSLGSSPFAAGSAPLVKHMDSTEPQIPSHYDPLGDTQWVPEHMRCARPVKRIDLPYEVTRRVAYDLMTERVRQRASAAAAAALVAAGVAGGGGEVAIAGPPVTVPPPPQLDAFLKSRLISRYGSEEVALQYSYALITASERYSADVNLWAFNMVFRMMLSELVFDVISADVTVFVELCAHVATLQQSFRARGSASGFDLSAPMVDFRITEKRRSEAVVEVLCTTTVHLVQILSAMYPGYSTAQLRRLLKAAKRTRVGGDNVTGGSNSLYYMMLFPEMQSNAMLLAERAGSSVSSENAAKMMPSNAAANAPRETPFSSLFKRFIVEDALQSACYVNERLARFEKRWRTVNCQQLVTLGLQYLDTEDAKVWVSAFRDPLRDIFFSITGESDTGTRRAAVGNTIGRDSLQSSLSMAGLMPDGGDADENVSLSSVSVKDVAERLRASVVVRQSVLPLSSKREDVIRASMKQKAPVEKNGAKPEWVIPPPSPSTMPSNDVLAKRPPKATIIEPNTLECHGVANSALVFSKYHMVVAEKAIAVWEQTTFDEQLISVNAQDILQEIDAKRVLPWTIRTANTTHRIQTTHTA